MKALIVENAYIKNKSQLMQAERIAEELRLVGIDTAVLKNFNLASIQGGKIQAGEYDFCVFLDKDAVAARLLEGAGMRLFNSAQAIETCDDKMFTLIALAKAGYPVPDSVYAPLCYYKGLEEDESFLKDTIQKLGLPLVAKTNYGSLGAGVSLISSYEELAAYEKSNMLVPHFYQRFVGKGGTDIRVIVIGGKYLLSMKRENKADFRSNVELGGTGEKWTADGALIKLCEGVASALSLDYCGIDVLVDGSGNYVVCEVNSNAFFAAAERVCGVNVARAYAEYIKSQF